MDNACLARRKVARNEACFLTLLYGLNGGSETAGLASQSRKKRNR
jgi:hypothetical protein